ncbi:MAG: Gfo/Idh/MocA family oxidoreductase [Deltaproteobacteria bacterium]|nr:Gfo/Idh/MocA family oxidoreductase [Deltaproteobacteria bacterium]MBW2171298.1 Gfo/Idh/MocA family oxidoreductase [Deltaproteobacteria bacterium]MBW2259552.1 Gfo/Idh/MocA family oxidoreductase [Deltaproteobacteria bacterium]
MTIQRNAISVGIIGCGHVTTNWHLPALRHVADVEVVALADIDHELMTLVGDRFHVRRLHRDYRELLSDSTIEAVAIFVPAQLHTEVALAALDAGKHVLIEKPLALSLDECDVLIEAAQKTSLIAMVGFNLRWHRHIRKALEVIRIGKLGHIKMIRSVFTCATEHADTGFSWKTRREAGGGTLIEMAVHHYDLWRLLLGSEVEEVFSMSRSDVSDDETAAVAARMDSGALASLALSEETGGDTELEIFGQNGRLRISLTRYDGLRFFPRSREAGDIHTHINGIRHGLRELSRVIRRFPQTSDWAGAFCAEWMHFIEAVRGREEVGCTLVEGRQAVEIALAATESASTGVPVRVSAAPRTITPVSTQRSRESNEH